MANKTVIQHFQELEPEVRKKAIANTIKQRGISYLTTKHHSTVASALSAAFAWLDTPEEGAYWAKMVLEMQEDTN
jgi:hypothetical protein